MESKRPVQSTQPLRWLQWLTPVAPAVFAMVAGCASSSTPQPAAPTEATADVAPAGTTAGPEEEDESTADLRSHHRHHHHGGFAMFIAMSLDSLGTTPEQAAAITKIQSDLHAKLQPAHDAEKSVLSTLADGVAAGSVDGAKVDAAIAQLSTAAAGVHDAVADALNQLHATLTPPQREALVGKLEAHFDVWRQVNAEDQASAGEHGHLARLSKELGLSQDQVAKIHAAYTTGMAHAQHFDPQEAEAHMRAFASAFASDSFDAKTLTTGGPANAHMATWGATRMAHLYEAVTPVLTADQRTKLADMLRRHANYKRTETAT